MGVGARAPTNAPPAMAFQIVELLFPSHVCAGSGAPKIGFNPKKGSLVEQYLCASDVSLVSCSARALGFNSAIHLSVCLLCV